jgi:hypothetical protein
MGIEATRFPAEGSKSSASVCPTTETAPISTAAADAFSGPKGVVGFDRSQSTSPSCR